MSTINEEYEHWFKNKEYMVRDSTLAAYDLMYRNHIKMMRLRIWKSKTYAPDIFRI